MAQAKGSSGQLTVYKEASFGVSPGTPHALILPINTSGLKSSRNLVSAKTIRGRRDAVQPSQGKVDAGGSIEVPVDLRAFGWWLQAGIGAPTTTQFVAVPINNGGAAVDVGGGVVGIPVTDHGFQAGEAVTIEGTTNYNGAHTVLPGSTDDQLNIPASFVAETFGAGDTVQANRYTHIFKVAPSLFSYVMEQAYKDISQYQLFNGCKVNKLDLKAGGDDELTATLDIMAAKEVFSQTPYDAAPTSIPLTRFNNFQASINEGGVQSAIIKEVSFSINNNLDGDTFCIGGGGVRGALNEGICNVSGTINAIFQDAVLYNKAVQGTESSIELIFTNGVHSLGLKVPEVVYKRQAPGLTTQGGIWVELPWEAYFDNDAGNSAIIATLVNDVPSYVWN